MRAVLAAPRAPPHDAAVIDRLTEAAFLIARAVDANATLASARELRGGRAFSFEAVVPEGADERWLRDELLPKLVYHCESRGAALPACGGVFVSFFVGDELRCVDAAEVIVQACAALGTTPAELTLRHGTGEVRHPIRFPGADA